MYIISVTFYQTMTWVGNLFSTFLVTDNLIHKFLFYNTFIICLYMFRALYAHHQEVKIVLYSIWYHRTETSEWSKVTKIQFYKYDNIILKFYVLILRVWFYCIFLHHKHVMSCRGYVYPVIKLIKKVLCLFTLHICWFHLDARSAKHQNS